MKTPKKILFLVVAMAAVLTVIFRMPRIDLDAAEPSVSITSPTAKSTYEVARGSNNLQLEIKYKVKGGTATVVNFKTSDSSVVSVNKKTGKAHVKKTGTAVITVSVKLTSGKIVRDSLEFVVTQKVTSVKAAVKNSSKFNGYYYMTKGSKKSVSLNVKPSTATDKSVTYKSSNTGAVKISSKGVITAVRAGVSRITITAADDSGKKCSFLVKVINNTHDELENALTGRTYKGTGNKVVKYAKRFLGTPYVYGGTSLTGGVDCSGFTMQVYAHYKYTLNRVASDQVSNGVKIDLADLQPGDLVFFDFTRDGVIDHVGIYAGDYVIVHAGSSGVKEGYMKFLPYPTCAVRVLK